MRTLFFATMILPVLMLVACEANTVQDDDQNTSQAITDESPEGDSGFASLAAREHLAAQLGVDANDIAVENVEAQEWSDSCLGLGGPAESCAAVMTPGFEIFLTHDGTEYRYRTNTDGTTVRAEG